MTACSCPTTHLPGESTMCCACHGHVAPRTRVVPVDPSFGMLDGEPHEGSLAAETVPAKAEDAAVVLKGLAMYLDALTLTGARYIKVKAGWRLMLELRKAFGVHQLRDEFTEGRIEYKFSEYLPEFGAEVKYG